MLKFLRNFILTQKYNLKLKLPPYLWELMAKLIRGIRFRQYSERRSYFGPQNPLKTFYIIRRRPPGWGFFSNIFFVIQGIIYSEKHDYIPLVDMENYWMAELNSTKKFNGTYNSWCYFFNQTSEYSLDEVYKSKNVILSDGHKIEGVDERLLLKDSSIFYDQKFLNDIGKIISSYINLNSITSEQLLALKAGISWDPVSTLGIFVRGTSYFSFIPGVEGKWADFEFLVKQIQAFIEEIKPKSLYISTEDFRIYEKLCIELKHQTIIPSIRYDYGLTSDQWLSKQKTTHDNGVLLGHEKTQKYLMEIFLLSECRNFIATPSNASVFVLAKSCQTPGQSRIVLSNEVVKMNRLVKF